MTQLGTAVVGHLMLVVPPVVAAAIIGLVVVPVVRRSRRVQVAVSALANVGLVIPVVVVWVALPVLTGLRLVSVVHLWIALAWLVLPGMVQSLHAARDPKPVLHAARGLAVSPVRRLVTLALPAALPGLVAGLRRAWLLAVPAACVSLVFDNGATMGGLGQMMASGRAAGDVELVALAVVAVTAIAWAGNALGWLMQQPLQRRWVKVGAP